ncbi:MAG TPA: N-acetyl-1-D-myo-inositol-2-amino-2-deoxy-alpha-D-glucopyranoside deacetylase [Aldersonia sp.]
MGTAVTRRLVLVHAHPDDETITTGGTIARYVRAGVDVTVVTCTLGEEGEVIGDRWGGLVADRADQLGGYRIGELTAALGELGALGAGGPRFLGGAGRWRDSGMAGTPAAQHPRAFVNAPFAEAVSALMEVLRELRPQVVVSYDPVGGYGHPDHIQAHRVCTAAVEALGAGVYRGPAKFYWTVMDAAAQDAAVATMATVPSGWRRPEPGELSGVDPARVTTEIALDADAVAAKRWALAAHETQVSVSDDGALFALSNDIAQPILDREFFVLVKGTVGASREDDLFAGVGE